MNTHLELPLHGLDPLEDLLLRGRHLLRLPPGEDGRVDLRVAEDPLALGQLGGPAELSLPGARVVAEGKRKKNGFNAGK